MIKQWSPSRLSTWENCPRKAKYLYIDKLPEEKNIAAQRGQDVHKILETYTQQSLVPHAAAELTVSIEDLTAAAFHSRLAPLLHLHRRGKVRVYPEQKIALSEKLEVVEYFGPEVWVRLVLDLMVLRSKNSLLVVDYKTGKPNQKDHAQMDLYALGGFTLHPSVQRIETQLWYVDPNNDHNAVYTRKQHAKQLAKDARTRALPMLKDKQFPARPGPLCKWCHFSKRYGKNPICEAG